MSHLGPDGNPIGQARPVLSETIEVETLDGFAAANGLDSLCFLKADIAGWELNMLQGGASVLGRHHPGPLAITGL